MFTSEEKMLEQAPLFVGKPALNFTAKAVMPDNSIEDKFNLKEYANGDICVIFFWPLDFTFVCPSEILSFNNHLEEFTSRNAKIVGVSIDSHFCHLAWKNTSTSEGGIGNIQFPMVADIKKEIARMYNVLNDDGISMRGTFIIDCHFNLRHILINDLPLGRNVSETLRTIDAIHHHREHGEVCPAGWHRGHEAITPNSTGIKKYLSRNASKV